MKAGLSAHPLTSLKQSTKNKLCVVKEWPTTSKTSYCPVNPLSSWCQSAHRQMSDFCFKSSLTHSTLTWKISNHMAVMRNVWPQFSFMLLKCTYRLLQMKWIIDDAVLVVWLFQPSVQEQLSSTMLQKKILDRTVPFSIACKLWWLFKNIFY